MSNNKTYRNRTFLILGAALLSAAWMIAGPDLLQRFNWHPKAIDILVWIPAMIVFFWSISGHRKFLACERGAFRKLIGK